MADKAVGVATFRSELVTLINRHSMEVGSNTPDFILADYLVSCLEAFDRGVRRRLDWQRPLEALRGR